jgi:hypothetical protein
MRLVHDLEGGTMHYDVRVETTVQAEAASVWRVWSDFDRFTEWDPREKESKLEGPFAVGTQGWSKQKGYGRNRVTLTAIEEGARCQATTPLPGGRLVIDHVLADLGDGRTRLIKDYRATGPLALAFRLHYARRIRREVPPSFAALAAEANRIAASAA